jgi:hypothetical protein
MPCTPPPPHYDGTPRRHTLGRGVCLWRVHRQKYGATAFNTKLSDSLFGGGRFDATAEDPYLFCYAALDETTALAESVLHDDPPWTPRGDRKLGRPVVDRDQLSALAVTQDLELVSLVTGQDLAAVAQDHWLVTADGPQYAQTRGWARWLRRQAPWAEGFIWPSLRDPGGRAVILFGDRCAARFGAEYGRAMLHEIPELAVKFDSVAGTAWLNRRLAPYRAAVEYPEPARRPKELPEGSGARAGPGRAR